MKPEEESARKRLARIRDRFRRSGVKLTHQRLEIVHEMAKCENHPDAETIYRGVRKRVPTVSLDTVYRTLWLLVDLGLLTSVGPPRERMRFDANMNPHHHFICMKCGMIRDFYSEELNGVKIPGAVKTLGNVKTVQLDIRGICLRCMKKTNHKNCV